jgi:23S rRNA (adenine-N6)-dimethyltransferase
MKRLPTLSQNFLRSPRLAAELIGHSTIKANDTVYDIGAGSGVITMVLAKRCRNVVAVEIDPRAAATLRNNMQPYPNVTVHQADFLTMPLPRVPYKIIANIPFNLSAAIVRKITESSYPPASAYLIVQKQFAQKLQAESSHYTSQLGITMAPQFAVRIRRPLRRSDFTPPPHVDTVFLEIKRRPVPLIEPTLQPVFTQFITQCFTDPHYFSSVPLQAAGIKPGLKASQLTLPEWLRLFGVVTKTSLLSTGR